MLEVAIYCACARDWFSIHLCYMTTTRGNVGVMRVGIVALLIVASVLTILTPSSYSYATGPQTTFVRNFSLATPELEFSPVSITRDGDGNLYVIDGFSCKVKKISPTVQLITSWGSCGSGDGQFNAPQDIAIDSQGDIYVLDRNNYRIQKFSASGTFITKWGVNGTGNGEFSVPHNLLVDHSDNIFVSDNNRVQKFTGTGTYLAQWGSFGSGDGQFNYADTMAVDGSNNIYVTDRGNYRVQKFSNTGTFLTKWGTNGTGNSQFGGFGGIAIDNDNTVYVSDNTASGRTQTFTTGGSYIGQWSGYGSHIVPDNNGHLYLVDVDQGRIRKVTTSGTHVAYVGKLGGAVPFPASVSTDIQGNVYIADRYNFQVQKRTQNGDYINKLYATHPNTQGPNAITVGPDGKIYAAYLFRNIVEVYSPNYQLLMTLGTYTGSAIGSSADGEFRNPTGVAIDSQGNIYVSDMGNLRVEKFDASGNFIKKWGGSGNGPGQFSNGGGGFGPWGIAVDASDNVYVADPANNRIQKFSSQGVYLDRIDGTRYAWPVDAFERTFMGVAGVDESGNRYRPDTANQQIVKTSPSGVELQRWGGAGNGNGQLSLVADTYTRVLVYQDEVYVADTGNNRIQVFGLDGSYIRQWGTAGSGDGQFNIPTDIMVDSDGNLQVADVMNARIQTFDTDGTYLGQWAQGSISDASTVAIWTLQDTSGNGDYYVGTLAGGLLHYTSDRTLVGEVTSSLIGTSGSDPGWLNKPLDIAIDGQGYVYVVDTNNNRIQVYKPDGRYVAQWGGLGSGDGQFNAPQSVAIGLNNQVYVADGGNQRVQQFTVELPPLVTPNPDPDPTPTPTPGGNTPTSPSSDPSSKVSYRGSSSTSPDAPVLPSDTLIVLTVQPNHTFSEDRPVLTGYTVPFGWVEVTVYSTPQTGKVQADATGFWQWQPPKALEPGSHRYEARIINEDGSYGKLTDAVAFTVSGEKTSIPEPEDQSGLIANDVESATSKTSNSLLKWLAVGITSAVALVLIIWLLRRKRAS